MKVNFAEPDAIDLQELREMVASRAWQLYASKIASMLGADVKALIGADDDRAAVRLQGGIRRLETVLSLPSILEGEIKEKVQKHAVDAKRRQPQHPQG